MARYRGDPTGVDGANVNEFGMYPTNTEEYRRWTAEHENAEARRELARMRYCCALILNQHDPVASLGIDRKKLKPLIDFIQHGDASRLRRDCEALLT